ncbi:MAG TPA: hypothetical protein VNR65_07960 [Geobacterales bacterium]|jgi:hypothetical protein|nr:hypothetical protein [Geobacterales bacterium]
MSNPPLQWFIDVHSVHAPLSPSYEANKHELEALKRYAEVEDLTSFSSELRVSPLSAGKFKVAGRLKADAVQASIVDLSAVPAAIDETFSVEFWPQELIDENTGDDVSLGDEPPEPIVGGRIAIGEFLSELFSVSLNPYPRNSDDAFSWEPAEKEPRVTPFAELARLRQKKSDGG